MEQVYNLSTLVSNVTEAVRVLDLGLREEQNWLEGIIKHTYRRHLDIS